MFVSIRQPTRQGNNVHAHLYFDGVRAAAYGIHITPKQFATLIEVLELARDKQLIKLEVDPFE
jgi:aromatic ring-cleaving dioxygenase